MVIPGLDVRKPREGDYYIFCNFIDETSGGSGGSYFLGLVMIPSNGFASKVGFWIGL